MKEWKTQKTRLGCEILVDQLPSWLFSQRLGLLVNQASVTGSFRHTASLIREAGGKLCCLFSPQHGFHGDKQANMKESPDQMDDTLRVPVFSLYGEVRQPTVEMLDTIDVLLIDLQDVGTRVYTYGTTMGLCLEQAARVGIKVVILDRPNPIGGRSVEGNIVAQDHRSFVGRYPIPMRHGLTMGELARFIVTECRVPCDLEVIPMHGWNRGDYFPATGLDWVLPSPNMPSWETALLYPGMVLLEGTNVSEGRGTTLPFHLFGAPFVNQPRLADFLMGCNLEGVAFRPVCFEPVFDKWRGEMCYGFQIHITDPENVRPYRLGLSLIQGLYQLHGEQFSWLPPPYEYEWEKLPIDILLGNGTLRRRIEAGEAIISMEDLWHAELAEFERKSEGCLLYS
jgi:uncharacterized protein YbbC (DUF1343 family)